ncbi:hypothetical protein OOK39_02340 [Streptomyces sp. NBC_00264]|uniref:hypothetical protein n=1 Tax=unclassified Streptomyces TaxID=2593676 RepID=UPI002252CCAF|nr:MULTISPECIES: hypothetical protein [unclassified Streptomyces]MCX5158140.1 hypothetical protein [Streptomyces sp. NBC_00305]MCX5216663.1 hypothetical protein [Streptomyces sp. NBC_00264]
MSARDELREYADRYGYTEHVNGLLDAFRAEVLAEAADKLALELTAEGATMPGYPLAVRSAARSLRRMADEAATGGAS